MTDSTPRLGAVWPVTVTIGLSTILALFALVVIHL